MSSNVGLAQTYVLASSFLTANPLFSLKSLFRELKSPLVRRQPVIMETYDDILSCIPNLARLAVVPVIMLSAVTGDNVQLLTRFFNLLPKPPARSSVEATNEAATIPVDDQDVRFSVEECFDVPGVGYVLAGVLQTGTINLGTHHGRDCNFHLGPGMRVAFCLYSDRPWRLHYRKSGLNSAASMSSDHCSVGTVGHACDSHSRQWRFNGQYVNIPRLVTHR